MDAVTRISVHRYPKTSNKRLVSNKSRLLIGVGCTGILKFDRCRASKKRLPPIAAGSKTRLKFIAAQTLIRSSAVYGYRKTSNKRPGGNKFQSDVP